jgi:glucose-6-phosphate isomerase
MKRNNIQIKFFAGEHQSAFRNAVNELREQNIVNRIFEKDYTIWNNKPDEITNRLGWLYSPEHSLEALDDIKEFVNSVRKEGFKNTLLLGMGGSSLAPEVFSKTFGVKKNYLNLEVLSSTHPGAVLRYSQKFNPSKTLYIVSTKSGGTVETLSFMKYFHNQAVEKLGKENAGKHFIAITDPGSGLEKIAKEFNFSKIFLNDPNIGGRYSALSYFGIVPAALIGVDTERLLKQAMATSTNNESVNSAAELGAFIGEFASLGKDKLTFILSDEIEHFGVWIEQLIAESSGKSGKGIFPVVGETILAPEKYSNDRLFVYIKLENDLSLDKKVNMLKTAGHPLIEITLKNLYSLGEEFFKWEIATAVAGWRIRIQPFNQPNVESAKVLARKMVKEYSEKGMLPGNEISIHENGIKVYANSKWESIKNGLNEFLNEYSPGDANGKGRSYVSLQAYLNPDKITSKLLQEMRTNIEQKYKLAASVAYGPSFLHSTGQLHKGDSGHGLFIQLTDKITEDVSIPDNMAGKKSSISFGILIHAQALGDRQALIDSGRKIITFELDKDITNGLEQISKYI